jgi:hypothetical protein
MRIIRVLSLLLLMLAGLHFSNPGPQQFSNYLSNYVAQELNPGSDDVIAKGLGKIAGAVGGELATRHDLFVVSIYQIDVLGKRHTFLAVVGQFIPLGQPEAIK